MTPKTKCLIVDDERNAILLIRNYIGKIPDLKIVGEFSDSLQALHFLTKNHIDLIFLDIEMPNLSGLELIKSLSTPPKVIIITAHRKFALEGYELEVVDYLLKPVVFSRFLKSFHKYNQLFNSPSTESGFKISSNRWEAPIFLKAGSKTNILQMKDILYIEGMNEYLKIHLHERQIVLKRSLKSIMDSLPEDVFLRVHRSYIISSLHVKSFTSLHVELADKTIPISSKYRKQALEALTSIKSTI